MAKKIKVVALVGVNHTITQSDLDANPHLVTEGVKVGEEVLIGNDVKSDEIIKNLEIINSELESKLRDYETSADNLLNELNASSIEHENQRKAWQALEKELKEAKETPLNVKGNKGHTLSPQSILVNHGVIMGGKKFTKEQIEADTSIQEVLFEMGSTAVTKIEG